MSDLYTCLTCGEHHPGPCERQTYPAVVLHYSGKETKDAKTSILNELIHQNYVKVYWESGLAVDGIGYPLAVDGAGIGGDDE